MRQGMLESYQFRAFDLWAAPSAKMLSRWSFFTWRIKVLALMQPSVIDVAHRASGSKNQVVPVKILCLDMSYFVTLA
jgi:hypothetical protein